MPETQIQEEAVIPAQAPETSEDPKETMKEKKKGKPRPHVQGNGIGILLQPRDYDWLTYLARGPARFPEAEKYYINEATRKVLPNQLIYRRLNQLITAEIIIKRRYKHLKQSNMYYLTDIGAEILQARGIEPQEIRTQIVPANHVVHEWLVAGVLRKMMSHSGASGTYRFLSYQDDRMMKYANKFRRGEIYPDLKVRLQPFDGPWVEIMIEVEGLQLKQSRYMKKLRGLANKTQNLVIFARHEKRIETLYEYTHLTIPRPKHIYFCLVMDFIANGLSGRDWRYFPDKTKQNIRFR